MCSTVGKDIMRKTSYVTAPLVILSLLAAAGLGAYLYYNQPSGLLKQQVQMATLGTLVAAIGLVALTCIFRKASLPPNDD